MEVVATDDDTEQVSTSGLAANEDAHIQGVSSAVSDESELESADSDCNDDDCDHEGMWDIFIGHSFFLNKFNLVVYFTAFIQHLSTLPEMEIQHLLPQSVLHYFALFFTVLILW